MRCALAGRGSGVGARRTDAGDRGSATAEFAVAVPALMLMLFAGVSGVGSVVTKLRCLDAAREAALAEARGEPGEPVGLRVAPAGATVSVRVEGEMVRVVVRATVRPVGGRGPGFVVAGEAVAMVEPAMPARS